MANMNCFRAVLVFVILMSRWLNKSLCIDDNNNNNNNNNSNNNNVIVMSRWLNKSLCIDGTNLRSQFRLHSLARDTLDSFFQADNFYRQPEEDEASGEQNLQPSIGDNNRSTNINNVENLV